MCSAMLPQTPPNKASLIPPQEGSSFSPVQLRQSPASLASQRNLTGLPRVVRDIAADVYNNVQKWNEQHVCGAKVVQQVAIVKSDSTVPYPEGLESLTKELYDIVQKLSIYSNALLFLASQMKALIKLNKADGPLFLSLTIGQLADLTDAIANAYKAEFQTKQYILENIAHSKTKNEVMYFATSWIYQVSVSNNINLKLETLLTETGHRKVT